MDKGSNKLKQALPDNEVGEGVASSDDTMQAPPESGVGSAFDDKMPQTCCSTCKTVFEVSPELLASSDTRVRCGECLSIFDALSNLRHNDIPEEEEAVLMEEAGSSLASNEFFSQGVSSDADDSLPGAASDTSSHGWQSVRAGADEAALDLPTAEDLTLTEDLSGSANLTGTEDLSGSANLTGTEDLSGSANLTDAENLFGTTDPTHAGHPPQTDYDLFSGNAGLPDVAYLDQTREMGSLNFDEPDGDETFSDEIFAHDLTLGPTAEIDTSVSGDSTLDAVALDSNVDFVTDDVKREPVVFNYQDRAPESSDYSDPGLFPGGPDILPPPGSLSPVTSSSSSGRWALRGMLGLLVIVIAGGLYGYANRQAIVQNPDMRPALDTVCSVIGCQLPPLVRLDELKVLKRSVFSHPTVDNELVIDLAFVNEAAFSQAYPVLEIRLTDLSGGLVVQKNIEPADYLENWQAGDLLSAGRRLDLSLTVEDPGQTATSFELEFR